MITKQVVFLLGAGASRGYGYPTGAKLMASLTSVNGDQLHELEQAGVSEEDAKLFPQRLRDCGLNSVDLFLKKNPAFGRTAKLRIAQELSASEYKAARGVGRTETWVQYLYSHFMDGGSLDAFRNNKCTFVTLNYDRSLEFELTKMLSNSYGAPWKEAADAVRALKTIHLHGSIGPLPDLERLYGVACGLDEIKQAGQRILTLGEPGSEREYEAAGESLRAAEGIFSLGFGFHQETIESLDIRKGTVPVHGTCQGLTQSEVNRVIRQFMPCRFVELLRDDATWNHKPHERGPVVDYLRANVGLLE
jgi:hypothetical protein